MTLISTFVVKPINFLGKRMKTGFYRILNAGENELNQLNGGAGGVRGDNLNSPFSFLTSNYAFTLIVMTILINRIHHLIPPRTPNSIKITPFLRALLRTPSLLLLARAILLLSGILAEKNAYNFMNYSIPIFVAKMIGWLTAFTGKSTLISILEAAGNSDTPWIVEESKVMMEIFIGTASAIVTEAFVRALDDDLVRQTSFNILSFSFLLHIHSTPSATIPPNQFPNQLYLHLLLVLSELFSLHLSYSLQPPLPPLKLWITGFYSLLGQGLIAKALSTAWKNRMELATVNGAAAVFNSVESGRSWEGSVLLSRLPEIGFEIAIVLTIFLRLIAAALRREPITKDSILGHSSHYPVRNEDWALAMIKYGSSCLESTRLMGLANEVDSINLTSSFSKNQQISYVELSRGSTGEISKRLAVGDELKKMERMNERGSMGGDGLRNEIIAVDVRDREKVNDPMVRDPDKFNELWKFFKNVYKIIYYLLWQVYQFNKRQYRRATRLIGLASDSNELEENWKISTDDDLADENYSPSTIDSDSSDEDEDENGDEDASEIEEEEEVYDPTSLYRDLSSPVSRRHRQTNLNSSPIASASKNMIPYFNHDDGLEEDESSTITSAEQLMPIFLAHQLTNSNSPLTRRRYQAMSNPKNTPNSYNYDSSSSKALTSAIESRRQELSLLSSSNSTSQQNKDQELEEEELEEARQAERDRSRTCIVCSVEERTIILWPCRCLCICNDCRESIAERSNQSSSLCPTCRVPIKGYSRIYIP